MTKRSTLRNPETCPHGATHRVSGTRNLWHCVMCGGMLEDNVTLVEAGAEPVGPSEDISEAVKRPLGPGKITGLLRRES